MKKRDLFYVVLFYTISSLLIIQASNLVGAVEIDESIINKLRNQTEVSLLYKKLKIMSSLLYT